MTRRKSANGDPQPRPVDVTRADGTVVKRFRITVTVGRRADGSLERRTKEFAKQADAIAWKREQLGKRAAGGSVVSKRSTLAEYLSRWLETVTANRAEATSESYGYAVRLHIVPHIGATRLDRLDLPIVESWLAGMLERNVGARTRQNSFRVLNTALRYAVRRGDLSQNPLELLTPPTAHREPPDPFTKPEVERILAAIESHRLAALLRVLFSTGCRQGESFGLRWSDVDLDAATIKIVRQIVETKGRLVVRPPKTKTGFRSVPITPATVDALRDHRRRMHAEGNCGELVFVGREGAMIRRSTFGARVWRPLLESLLIRHRGAHHTRHTYATLMLGAGVTLPIVANRLGHARPSITADLYAHAVADQTEAARASETRLFG